MSMSYNFFISSSLMLILCQKYASVFVSRKSRLILTNRARLCINKTLLNVLQKLIEKIQIFWENVQKNSFW